MIGRQLASHPKNLLPHAVVAGVVGPNGCEDLTNRAEVLLDLSLLDRLPLCGQKAGTDALSENLEAKNGVLNVIRLGAIWSQMQ